MSGDSRKVDDDAVLAAVARYFLASAQKEEFNGATASHLARDFTSAKDIRTVLSRLVTHKFCTLTFASADINPHIKRLPDLPIEKQLALLRSEELTAICVYPSRPVLQEILPQKMFAAKPFSRELALAAAQLDFFGFQLAVMDRYTKDPNYKVDFHDYMGALSVKDSANLDVQFPDRDKVSLQTFGLGFDSNNHPCIIVFCRYLASLSPEHQQYWQSFKIDTEVRLTEQYYQASIEGHFWENRSARHAIECEIKLINEMAIAIWGKSIFRISAFPSGTACITAFSRPTAVNFGAFVQELDKMLSDNIDVKFFDNFPSAKAAGFGKEQKMGSIQLLRNWLLHEGMWESTKLVDEIIIEPLREIRKERNTVSHRLATDNYSAEYYKKRKRTIWRAFNGLSNIRAFLSNHPKAKSINIPEWLDGENFDVF